MFTDADNFGVVFPMDLDTKMKAVTMAATFLIVSLQRILYVALVYSTLSLPVALSPAIVWRTL